MSERGLKERPPTSLLMVGVQDLVVDCMDQILARFKPGAKITVYVRQPDYPDGSRDLVTTNDDLKAVAESLAKAGP